MAYRRIQLIFVITVLSLEIKLATEVKTCSLLLDKKKCTTGKEICGLCFRNMTKGHVVLVDEVRSATLKCRRTSGHCKLTCRKTLKKHHQDDNRTTITSTSPWCLKQTAELITCEVSCTGCTLDDLCETHHKQNAHSLSETAKVAIICSAFALIVVLFVIYMTYRRRKPSVYGVVFMNNSTEPFVSLVARQSAIDSTSHTDYS